MIKNRRPDKNQSFNELAKEQRKLSLGGNWNDIFIKEKMDEGWTFGNWD